MVTECLTARPDRSAGTRCQFEFMMELVDHLGFIDILHNLPTLQRNWLETEQERKQKRYSHELELDGNTEILFCANLHFSRC